MGTCLGAYLFKSKYGIPVTDLSEKLVSDKL